MVGCIPQMITCLETIPNLVPDGEGVACATHTCVARRWRTTSRPVPGVRGRTGCACFEASLFTLAEKEANRRTTFLLGSFCCKPDPNAGVRDCLPLRVPFWGWFKGTYKFSGYPTGNAAAAQIGSGIFLGDTTWAYFVSPRNQIP